MKKICILAWLAIVLVADYAVGQSDSREGPLIPVLPRYQEAVYGPQNQGADPFSGYQPYAPPNPKDQLYVFWFLGQIISYPVDRAEALIARLRKRNTSAAGPAYEFNPFESASTRHIPPAPPVTDGSRISRQTP